MELRWLVKKVPAYYNELGDVVAVKEERVLQLRNVYGWHDVEVERESMNKGE